MLLSRCLLIVLLVCALSMVIDAIFFRTLRRISRGGRRGRRGRGRKGRSINEDMEIDAMAKHQQMIAGAPIVFHNKYK